ncbi:MAG: YfiR family protein [Gammaproteobacteria bacterium]
MFRFRSLGVVIVLSILSYPFAVEPEPLSLAEIKAAYIANFAKFVEWPADTLPKNGDLVLCVVGGNVLDGALDALSGRMIGEHRLRLESHQYSDLDLTSCHMLYIGISEQQRFLVTLKLVSNASVLTLSDIDDFAEKGGSIGLLFRDNKLVFEVNLEPIRKGRLHLPGQLLNIAAYIYGR